MPPERVLQRFLGRELEMNDHRAMIVGVCEATPDVPVERGHVHHLLPGQAVRPAGAEDPLLRAGQDRDRRLGRSASEVAAAIAAADRAEGRGPATEFIWDTIEYYLKYTGIPINFGITAVLGFLVGTAIAGQTFYNFTIENLKQFGALKAMGATNGRIVGDDPAPGDGRRAARLRHRRRAGRSLRLADQGGRARLLHPLAAPADHGAAPSS